METIDLIKEVEKRVVPPTYEPLLSYDEVIPYDLSVGIAEFVGKDNFNTIFPPVEKLTPEDRNKNSNIYMRQFKVEIKCSVCGCIYITEMTKTKYLEYLRYLKNNDSYSLRFNLKCSNCLEEERLSQQIEEQKQKLNQQIDLENKTKEFINNYLSSDSYWNEGVPTWQKINELETQVTDNALDYASKMNYYEFLKTPYWLAISEKVKKDHKYTCQLCGKSNTILNVHHPATYRFRGYELYHIKELTCLCQDCHYKFHKE